MFSNNSANPQRDVWIQLACALHRLGHSGTGAGIGMVSRAKGVSYGSVCNYTKRVIKALNDLVPKYIFWPGDEERRLLSKKYHEAFGFEGCIGSTDGTHIVLFQKPGLDGEVFFNRKHTYSMNVLLTFDLNRQIRYVLSGWPGSVHDNTVWEKGFIAKAPERFFFPWAVSAWRFWI